MADFTVPYYGSKPHPTQYEPYYGSMHYGLPAMPEMGADSYAPSTPKEAPHDPYEPIKTSNPKVRTVYQRYVSLEKEYATCGESAISLAEIGRCFERLEKLSKKDQSKPISEVKIRYKDEVESDIATLALKVKELQLAKAPGADRLKERVYQLIVRVIQEVNEELSSLEDDLNERRCLSEDDRRALSTSRKYRVQEELDKVDAERASWRGKSVTYGARLRERHACLIQRVALVDQMIKAIPGTYFSPRGALDSKFHIVTHSSPAEEFRDRLSALKGKLPDSEFVHGVKSFTKGVKGFFSPSPSPQSAYVIPPSSEHLREQEKILAGWVMFNVVHDGTKRVLDGLR
ncbi:MAG: hypothetical protein KFB93_01440 [Simkaniaceae bacterium]|nr:MAG: hypothetical protein KFB93_01440 [Simkaniaceae bacterium]